MSPVALKKLAKPKIEQETHVGREFLFALAFARRSHDEAARNTRVMDLKYALQPKALLIARDFARHAGMFERRHVYDVAARQRDVRCASRALLTERFLGALNNDLVAFLQQFRDGGQWRSLGARESPLLRPRLFRLGV
jgi:hypothetical protein